jgi:hypothetical protein
VDGTVPPVVLLLPASFMSSLLRDLVFVGYSHQDATWLERMVKFLKPYTRQGELSSWSDRCIEVGGVWLRHHSRRPHHRRG